MMTLTTPATASEPYAAEAPPVTTSMRAMSMEGTTLRSTAPPELVGTKRSELMSVRVRVPKKGFKPRRLANCAPMLKFPKPDVRRTGEIRVLRDLVDDVIDTGNPQVLDRAAVDRRNRCGRVEGTHCDVRTGDDDLLQGLGLCGRRGRGLLCGGAGIRTGLGICRIRGCRHTWPENASRNEDVPDHPVNPSAHKSPPNGRCTQCNNPARPWPWLLRQRCLNWSAA